ncbi:MAG: ZIP family metal transporter [Oscillospiraceae bacterium]|nr:ZIP family metal transporter [Oscillospiraceae bacterium]
MSDLLKVIVGIIVPLLGTTLGAGTVFFVKGDMKPSIQKALLGFASGVMIAASVWSLLIPAIEMEKVSEGIAWLPAVVGFLFGIGFLLFLDSFIPHLHLNSDRPEGRPSRLGRSLMLVLAVTLHNIPEGMAVGVVLAGMLGGGETGITTASAFALAIGIAIQNFPEGAIISMPLVGSGMSRGKAFRYGFLSGVVEPAGAILTIALTALVTPLLPYILSFAAGAMIYVVVEELIPEAQAGEHSNIGTIGVALGFSLMMMLDVALG